MKYLIAILLLGACAGNKENIVNEYLLNELIQTRNVAGQYQQAFNTCQQANAKKVEEKKK